MAWYYQRLDRLKQIVAVLVKNDICGTETRFCDSVLNIAATQGVRTATARDYVAVLLRAYRHDRWKSYLLHNPYIEKEEAEKWISAKTS